MKNPDNESTDKEEPHLELTLDRLSLILQARDNKRRFRSLLSKFELDDWFFPSCSPPSELLSSPDPLIDVFVKVKGVRGESFRKAKEILKNYQKNSLQGYGKRRIPSNSLYIPRHFYFPFGGGGNYLLRVYQFDLPIVGSLLGDSYTPITRMVEQLGRGLIKSHDNMDYAFPDFLEWELIHKVEKTPFYYDDGTRRVFEMKSGIVIQTLQELCAMFNLQNKQSPYRKFVDLYKPFLRKGLP